MLSRTQKYTRYRPWAPCRPQNTSAAQKMVLPRTKVPAQPLVPAQTFRAVMLGAGRRPHAVIAPSFAPRRLRRHFSSGMRSSAKAFARPLYFQLGQAVCSAIMASARVVSLRPSRTFGLIPLCSAMPQKRPRTFVHVMSCSAQAIVLGQGVPELGNKLFCSANGLRPSAE